MIRDMQEKDIPKLKELQAADGFEWKFPEKMFSAKVWVNAKDEPVMMIGGRMIAEAVLISSKEGTPAMRLAILQELSKVVFADAKALGVTEGVTWIPDCIWKAYSRRLKALGWMVSKFKTMSLIVQ